MEVAQVMEEVTVVEEVTVGLEVGLEVVVGLVGLEVDSAADLAEAAAVAPKSIPESV